MGQVCNGQEKHSSEKESLDLMQFNSDKLQNHTVKEMEQIEKNLFQNAASHSFDSSIGHAVNIYKNEILFVWNPKKSIKIQFKIKQVRRTANTPFSYFNNGQVPIRIEIQPTNNIQETLQYKTMNYQDYKQKYQEIKDKQKWDDDFENQTIGQ